jgi:hypothetical protein
MSQPNTELQTAAAETAANAIKVAHALREQLAKAPKAASAELCKEAAEALVNNRWTSTTDVTKVAAMLADPTVALSTLTQLVKAASERIIELSSGDRLAAGREVPSGNGSGTAKKANDSGAGGVWGRAPAPIPSEADAKFEAAIMAAAHTVPR